ncbi:MAG: glycosyltransferase family 2 protein [Patescibacteria group bacterium]
MKQKPKVSVIILTWNAESRIAEQLDNLASLNINGLTVEVIVVDNNSSDKTTEIAKGYKFSNMGYRFIQNDTNLGFAEGNNVGMRYALNSGSNYIALQNDDTILDKNLLINMVGEFRNTPTVGAISPKIYFAKGYEFHKHYKKSDLGKIIWYAGGNIDWNNVYGSNRGVDEVDHGQFDESRDTDFATGCFVVYKREALKKAGLYDKRYYLYMEDADHAQRLKKTGFRVMYSPMSKLWHKVSQGSAIGSELNDYYLTRNRMIFGMKYARLWTKQALLRESFRLLLTGRKWQKIGIRDFYLGRLGKGSWR